MFLVQMSRTLWILEIINDPAYDLKTAQKMPHFHNLWEERPSSTWKCWQLVVGHVTGLIKAGQ